MTDLSHARTNMVQQQIRPWGVLDNTVLDLIGKVPRELFVPPQFKSLAYADTALPLGDGQHMLPPKEVARALQALSITHTDNVLEIGTGSGYITALLGYQAKKVTSLEILPRLYEEAKTLLAACGLSTAILQLGNGGLGFPAAAPYHKIFVTGAYPHAIPQSLVQQLTIGGKLFTFIGQAPRLMQAICLTRLHTDHYYTEILYETMVDNLIDVPNTHIFHF